MFATSFVRCMSAQKALQNPKRTTCGTQYGHRLASVHHQLKQLALDANVNDRACTSRWSRGCRHTKHFLVTYDKEVLVYTSAVVRNEWGQRWWLVQVVEGADVVLEVLDARDPLGTRSPQLEQYVLAKRKRLVLVLNKIGGSCPCLAALVSHLTLTVKE